MDPGARSTDMTADEAIDTIDRLPADEVQTFVEGDERVTVLAAAETEAADPSPPVADDLPTPAGTIPVDQITALQGFIAPPESVTRTGEALTGTEEIKAKTVTVRTRYPVDAFEVEGVTITATGVKVDADKLSDLVVEANRSGVALEKI